ncbi:MAG: hypothetical protein OET90_12165 [Desulfuromonadales bacterium]|nr:hypothetical protein [Desulfuromonadales bacterium]
MTALKRKKASEQQSGLDILESAFILLRRTPAELLCRYFIGAIPFALSVIFYWADMSRSGLAESRLASGSLIIALLWIWMRSWQAAFCTGLQQWLMQVPLEKLSLKRQLRRCITQSVTGPWSFLILPVALLITLPFGWCMAFFQNLIVIDDGGGASWRRQASAAWHQAKLQPRQNHVALLVLFVFSLIVLLNFLVALMILPSLMRSLLGIESIFGMGNFFLTNSTFWIIIATLTFLCIDPLIKTVYVLRCYHGAARQSGEDLLAELRSSSAAAQKTGVALSLLLCLLLCAPGQSEAQSETSTLQGRDANSISDQLSADELDQAIALEIDRLEYTWRMPRQEFTDEEEAELPGFVLSIIETVHGWMKATGEAIGAVFEWLGELIEGWSPDIEMKPPRQGGGINLRYISLYLLLAIAVSIAAILTWRLLHHRRQKLLPNMPDVKIAEIDLEAEDIVADELPVDKWLALAKQLFNDGERRLGIRALYLATLASLADEQLLTIARAKSDRDYETELQRHGLATPDQIEAFSLNVRTFQSIWYGIRSVNDEMINQFKSNHRRITNRVEPA